MRFKHGAKLFQIDFRRHGGTIPGRTVTIEIEKDDPDNPGGTIFVEEQRPIPTRYPYTTVTVCEVTRGENGRDVFTPVRTATSGAYHKERFTLEKGRLAALRILFPKHTKHDAAERAFKEAVWNAYINRPQRGKAA